MRCAALGCVNESDHGLFIGEFCAPCLNALRTGKADYGTSWVFTRQARIADLERKFDMRQWSRDESRAWHLSIPDTEAAFRGLLAADGQSGWPTHDPRIDSLLEDCAAVFGGPNN